MLQMICDLERPSEVFAGNARSAQDRVGSSTAQSG